MATQLFLRTSTSPDSASVGWHLGEQGTLISGTTVSWLANVLLTSRGSAAQTFTAQNTVAGPTTGVDLGVSGTLATDWCSLPLTADVTISGTITFNVWASENNMSANVAINVLVEKISRTGVITTIVKTANVVEVAVTTAAANNFTATPTSTAMTKGDRIRVRLFGDDAGTMGTGFTFTASYNGPTAAAAGDTYVTFTENLSFLSADPTGTTLHLTDVAGPAVGANIEKEMWTSFGDGVNTAVKDLGAGGWTAPLQWTDTNGGTSIEWYSRALTAFTLSGPVLVSVWAQIDLDGGSSGMRAELAVCNGDGSGAVVWSAVDIIDMDVIGNRGTGTNSFGGLTGTNSRVRGYLLAPDVAVTVGQRLRLRMYVDDQSAQAMDASARFVTLRYDHTTTGTNDSFITLGQTVTEFVQYVPRTILVGPSAAVHQSHNW